MCFKGVFKINPRTGDIEQVAVDGASAEENERVQQALATAGAEVESVEEEVEYHYNDIVAKVAE